MTTHDRDYFRCLDDADLMRLARDSGHELAIVLGERLAVLPEMDTELALESAALASLGGRFDLGAGFVAATVGHTGVRNTGFPGGLGSPNYRLPAYTTLDVNAGTGFAGFDIGVYVRNLTDERGQVSANTGFVSAGEPVTVNFIRPRTFGVTLNRLF
jgi:hypothetical protein